MSANGAFRSNTSETQQRAIVSATRPLTVRGGEGVSLEGAVEWVVLAQGWHFNNGNIVRL